nr:hypothetical protein [Tanacetum cinerariifolium]
MPPRVMTRSTGRPVTESREEGTGVRVGRGGRGRRPRGGNDERVDELNRQGNNQGLGANEGVEGVNENIEGVNISGALTDEAVRNKVEKRGNVGELSRDRNVEDENKRTRI